MLCVCFYVAFRQSSEDEVLLGKADIYLNNVGLWTSGTICLSLESKGLSFDPRFCDR